MLSYLIIPFLLNCERVHNSHEIYISVLEVDAQQMKVKVFTDNLQDAIRNHSTSFVPASATDFLSKNEPLIETYFQQKIQLLINDRPITFRLANASLEGDSYWINLQLAPTDSWKSFDLRANYLMELFPDQTNVVKVMMDRARFFRLTSQNPSCQFKTE